MRKNRIRTFEIVQYVDGGLEGDINSWPSNLQDKIYAALDTKAKEVELPLAIVASYCDIDYGDEKGQDRYYVRVIASEVVATGLEKYKDEFDAFTAQLGIK